MIKEFNKLNEEEQDLLIKAPAMITIMIAGADDDIDEKETDKAKRLAKFKAISGDHLLMPYYSEVQAQFQNNLIDLVKDYPDMAELRNPIIAKQLSMINNILPKLPKDFAIEIYKSLKSFSKNVAEASGGFLGFLSVGPEENDWVELDMITDPRTYE